MSKRKNTEGMTNPEPGTRPKTSNDGLNTATDMPSSQAKEPGPDDAKLRALKILVIVLGIVLILGFFTVIGRIIYLVMRTPEGVPEAAKVTTNPSLVTPGMTPGDIKSLTSELKIPTGAQIRSVSIGDGNLLVHYGPAHTKLGVDGLSTDQAAKPTSVNVPSKDRLGAQDPEQGILVVDIKTGRTIRKFIVKPNSPRK
ncbi:MAG: hypothetical protein AAFV69_05315 [Pseudomonadota bacterium]